MAVKLSELLALPVEERLKLVEALWESVAECPEALELTAAQKQELDRRLAAVRARRRDREVPIPLRGALSPPLGYPAKLCGFRVDSVKARGVRLDR